MEFRRPSHAPTPPRTKDSMPNLSHLVLGIVEARGEIGHHHSPLSLGSSSYPAQVSLPKELAGSLLNMGLDRDPPPTR